MLYLCFPPNKPALLASLLSITLVLSGCDTSNSPTTSQEVATKSIQTAALSHDAQLAVIGSLYGGGSLWRVQDGERLFNWNHGSGERSTITAAGFAADGDWAATADDTFTLVLWNAHSGTAERFWKAPGEVVALDLNRTASRAVLGLAAGSAVVFDIRRGGILRELTHRGRINSVAIADDGRHVLTGSDDNTSGYWDLTTGELVNKVTHDDDVQLVRLSADGSLALSVSKYDKALLWRTDSGEPLGTLDLGAERLKRGLRLTAAAFDASNRYLATGRPDGIVELWQVDTLTKLEQWRLPKRQAWQPAGAAVLAVGFSADQQQLVAVASNGFMHTLDIKKPAANVD
jgi:WD40 repeat protein